MKKIKIVLVISLTLLFSGCLIKKKDITKITFPTTLLIAKENDNYQLYLLVIDNSSLSKIEVESSTDTSLYSTIMFEGKTIDEAISKLGIVTDGNLSAIKIRSIIFHSSIFDNSSLKYDDIGSYIINNPLFRTNIYVYYSKDDPKELLNINSFNTNNNAYFYLSRPDKKHITDYLLPSRLLDTNKSYIDNKRMFYLPSLHVSKDHFRQDDKGELKEVNSYTLDGAYFLSKNDSFIYVGIDKLTGLKWISKNTHFDVEVGRQEEPISLKVESLSHKIYIENNTVALNIIAKSKINYNYSKFNSEEIENKLKDLIYNDIMDTYNYTYNDIDIYLFNDLAYRKNKSIDNDTFILNIKTEIKNTIYEY